MLYKEKGSLEKNSGHELQGAWRQDELIGGKPPVVKQLWLWFWAVESVESVESCSCEKWEAGSWGRGEFGNPEEWERPMMKASTKQRPVRNETTSCVLYLQRSLECVTKWDCRSYS
jgi:hypothetical protein